MLEVGDLVKTYKHGYRRITHIAKNAFFNNPDKFQECMYIMKKNENMIDDLVITGYHAILVDNPDGEEMVKQEKYGITEKIDDKYLVISSISKLFEKDVSRNSHVYYHFSLESDDENQKFGVYANGVLCETIHRKLILDKHLL